MYSLHPFRLKKKNTSKKKGEEQGSNQIKDTTVKGSLRPMLVWHLRLVLYLEKDLSVLKVLTHTPQKCQTGTSVSLLS